MHSDHQRSFILYAATKAPELLVGKIDLDIALKTLSSYVEFAIVKPAEYLKESAKILNSIVSDSEFDEIGFGFNIEIINPTKNQMIKPQVALINEYLEVLFGIANEKSVLEILKIQDNPKFKTLFKYSPLPITLN